MEAQAPRPIRLEANWLRRLEGEFREPYMAELRRFLATERARGKEIYPPPRWWFRAFDATPFDRVKVVILGQDPYHGPGQAHGLCFSVPPGVEVPPSLANVYRELESDLGIPPASHGCLLSWARQGVLLLNATLTVERGRPGSHRGRGWERFTDAAVRILAEEREHLVFMLWGREAAQKGSFIDRRRHLVLSAPHPSPLSAHRGFFGCRHFSRANEYLLATGQEPVDWRLPPVGEDSA